MVRAQQTSITAAETGSSLDIASLLNLMITMMIVMMMMGMMGSMMKNMQFS